MELRGSFDYNGFLSNFERDIKSLFQIDQFTDEVQNNFGKLAIKYKVGLRLFLFFTSGTQNIWWVASPFCVSQFSSEEKNEYFYTRQKIYKYPSEHFLNQSIIVLPQI